MSRNHELKWIKAFACAISVTSLAYPPAHLKHAAKWYGFKLRAYDTSGSETSPKQNITVDPVSAKAATWHATKPHL